MPESNEIKNDQSDYTQIDVNNTMSIDTYTINMNSKLINNSITEFFATMDLSNIRELSLCLNRLSSIPNNFSECLINLEKLDLSYNNLEELPCSFSSLTKLKHLRLDHNDFQALPAVLPAIRCLKFLSVSHNKIEKYSEDLGDLFNLENLNLSFNNLSNLPYSLMRLNHLSELDLSGNKFEIIPDCIINGMRNLEILDLSLNKNMKLNVPPCSNRLRKFSAKSNGICRTFPRWILTSRFSTLEEINLNKTEFLKFKFPDENTLLNIKNLSITQSTLSDNILERLTRNMIKLEKIDIGNDDSTKEGNIFCNLNIQQLKNPQLVKQMYIQRTGIPMISRSVKDLRNITIMNIGGNAISWLPDEFCLLQKLEILIINNNVLSTLPDNFGNLIALKELIISSNQLSKLPASMINLKELRLLDLYDNDFCEIPWDIIHLENIQGVDIEYNFFSTYNIMIRNVSYEVLRKVIHERYPNFSQRSVGVKIHTREKDYSVSASSDSSQKSEYSDENDEDIQFPTDPVPFDVEENWDLSQNSTEEYEPNYIPRRKYQSSTVICPFTSCEHFFCPEDFHAKSVREELRKMDNDIKELMFTFEEGQFDDA